MTDFRSFAAINKPAPETILLSPEESHHLVRVNRARPGSEVILFNGKGIEWTCRYIETDRRRARLEIVSERESPPPPGPIALAQAIPKGKTFEQIVRKATELGARQIIPLITERTEVKVDKTRSETKSDKWLATAIEAAKQCGNSYLPEIEPPQSLEDFLSQAAGFELKLVASLEPDARFLRPILEEHFPENKTPKSAVWLVGPEGDFSPAEYQAAEKAGFQPVKLGPLVLRCDTAATASLSILSYEFQLRQAAAQPE